MDALTKRLHDILGRTPRRMTPLSGGCVGDVRRVSFEAGDDVAVKVGTAQSGLALEGRMLTYLAEQGAIPVPQVLFAADDLLVMEYIPGGDPITPNTERDAAEKLAALHAITAPLFGLEFDTVIGGLHQPNKQNRAWLDFFRDHRLLYMGRQALDAGRLPAVLFNRLETLCRTLDRWIDGTSPPSLIHGDLWTGNVIMRQGRLAAVVDPAIYYADAEIELAFTTMFGTFGDAFFRRYAEIRPIAPGFFEERRDLYNIYPLLVHVRLFGGSYVASVERTLGRFGF